MEGMSVYSQISKEIGHESPAKLPCKIGDPVVEDWIVAANAGDREAFKKLFVLYRFVPSQRSEAKMTWMNRVADAWLEIAEQFRMLAA
jgi:hypothetical protein